VLALRFAGQLFAASSPQNWILFITIPGALIPAILVGSSGDASATALDPIAAWHWPGGLASDGYGRDALGGAMSGHGYQRCPLVRRPSGRW
jgi:hypothetical protein